MEIQCYIILFLVFEEKIQFYWELRHTVLQTLTYYHAWIQKTSSVNLHENTYLHA